MLQQKRHLLSIQGHRGHWQRSGGNLRGSTTWNKTGTGGKIQRPRQQLQNFSSHRRNRNGAEFVRCFDLSNSFDVMRNCRSIRRIIFYSLIKPTMNEKGEKEMDTISVSAALQIAGRAGRWDLCF